MKGLVNIKKVLIVILILLNSNFIFGQGIEHNLEKYWYYRQRLEDKFIVISNGNEQGTNLPLALIGYRYNRDALIWGDGNGEMQYYSVRTRLSKQIKMFGLGSCLSRSMLTGYCL